MRKQLNNLTIWPFNNKKRPGFTLIELLVVISIIAILSSVVIVNYNSARGKARDTKRKADLLSIQSALELFYADNKTYPSLGTPSASPSPTAANPVFSTVDQNAFSGIAEYLEPIPQDPLSSKGYLYEYMFVPTGAAITSLPTCNSTLAQSDSTTTCTPPYYVLRAQAERSFSNSDSCYCTTDTKNIYVVGGR